MAATFAQKLLAHKSGKASVEPGEIVTVRPDHLLTHDNTAAIISKIGDELDQHGVADPEVPVIVLDHVVPASNEKTATNHKKIREFVARFEEQHSSIKCRELIGHDISTREKSEAAMKDNAFANCPRFVESAVTILDDILSS